MTAYEIGAVDSNTSGARTGTGPLVDLLGPDDAPLLLRDLYAGGDPGPIVAALAQVPELCQATLPFVGAALGPSSVGIRLKEIAILRTSALLGCRYCVDAHTVVAHDAAGFAGDQLCLLRAETDDASSIDDPVEAAALSWVDAVAAGRGPVPIGVGADASRHLPDHHLVELTTTVGATMFLNRFATALRLPTSADTLSRLSDLGLATWQPRPADSQPGPGSEA
ncbi:MAG: carboxymuconolactone decarboxylase family protein [Acidimicrobiales bacterium]